MKFAYENTNNTSYNFQPKASDEPIIESIKVNQAHEASKLFGREFLYLSMTNRTKDTTFNESIDQEFNKAYKIYAIRDNDTVFEGSDGFGSFGGLGDIPLYNEILHVPSKWFNDLNIKPIEGDLIKYPFTDKIFEIAKVDTQSSESLGTQTINDSSIYTYRLYLSTYHHNRSDEKISIDDTDELKELDDILKYIEEDDEVVYNDIDKDQTQIERNEKRSDYKISVDNPFGDL